MLSNGTTVFFRVGNRVVEGTIVEPKFFAGSWEGLYYVCAKGINASLTVHRTDVYTDKAKLLWKVIDSLDKEIHQLEDIRDEHYREVTKFQDVK